MLDISHFYVEKKDYERGSKHCPAKEKNMFLNLWNKIDDLNLLTRKYQTGPCMRYANYSLQKCQDRDRMRRCSTLNVMITEYNL